MNIRKEVETLALWYIPMLFIATFATFLVSDVLGEIWSQDYFPVEVFLTLSGWIPVFFGVVPNIVIAAWLFKLSRREGGRSILWFIFGFVGNLLSVVIYIAIQIYEQQTQIGAITQTSNTAFNLTAPDGASG